MLQIDKLGALVTLSPQDVAFTETVRELQHLTMAALHLPPDALREMNANRAAALVQEMHYAARLEELGMKCYGS